MLFLTVVGNVFFAFLCLIPVIPAIRGSFFSNLPWGKSGVSHFDPVISSARV